MTKREKEQAALAEREAREERARRRAEQTIAYDKHWDLSSIPQDVFYREIQSRRGKYVQNRPGKVRSCGHTKWVMSCPVCERNYKRTQWRIARGDHPSVRED